jgi:hypothetical protein
MLLGLLSSIFDSKKQRRIQGPIQGPLTGGDLLAM